MYELVNATEMLKKQKLDIMQLVSSTSTTLSGLRLSCLQHRN